MVMWNDEDFGTNSCMHSIHKETVKLSSVVETVKLHRWRSLDLQHLSVIIQHFSRPSLPQNLGPFSHAVARGRVHRLHRSYPLTFTIFQSYRQLHCWVAISAVRRKGTGSLLKRPSVLCSADIFFTCCILVFECSLDVQSHPCRVFGRSSNDFAYDYDSCGIFVSTPVFPSVGVRSLSSFSSQMVSEEYQYLKLRHGIKRRLSVMMVTQESQNDPAFLAVLGACWCASHD